MDHDVNRALEKMLLPKNLWLTIVLAGSLSLIAYTNHGILSYTLAIPVLFLVFDFAMRLFEIKQGLERHPLWKLQDVPKSFKVRMVQTLFVTMFWGLLMYLMVWFDDIDGLMVGIATFGVLMVVFGEWQARRAKPA